MPLINPHRLTRKRWSYRGTDVALDDAPAIRRQLHSIAEEHALHRPPSNATKLRFQAHVFKRLGSLYRPALSELLIAVVGDQGRTDIGYAITLQQYRTFNHGMSPCSVLLRTARSELLLEGIWNVHSLSLEGRYEFGSVEIYYHQSIQPKRNSKASIISYPNPTEPVDTWTLDFPTPHNESLHSASDVSLRQGNQAIATLYQGWDPFVTGWQWKSWLAGYFPALDPAADLDAGSLLKEGNLERAILAIVCVECLHLPAF